MEDKAQKWINELLKDVINRIKKQPATPQTTNALMNLFIRFPRTETWTKSPGPWTSGGRSRR